MLIESPALVPVQPIEGFPKLEFGEVVDKRALVVAGAVLTSGLILAGVGYYLAKETQAIHWSGPDIPGLSLPDVFSKGGPAELYDWIHSSTAELVRWADTVITYTSQLLNEGFVRVTYDPVASQQTGKVAVDVFGVLNKGQSALVEVNGLANGQPVCGPVRRVLTPPLRYEEMVLECSRRVEEILTLVRQPGYEATTLHTPIR